MTDLQVLFQLEKLFGKVMTLEQALEVMGRFLMTKDVLDEEGTEYDEVALLNELGDYILNEV